MTATTETRVPLWKRLFWMVVIWAGTIAVLGVFIRLLRLFMKAAGLGPQ